VTRNRIKVALPLYGNVSGTFLQNWLAFGSQIAKYDKYTGLVTTQRPYVDVAMNEIISGALQSPNWDYLFVIEQDMIMPEGLLERIATLDPKTHPIVTCLYFGRVQEDQRPVAGFMRDGIFHRLSYEEVCKMLPERGGVAGLHPVDVIGMGATAIHRSVFEQWGFLPSHPWFRTDYDDLGPLGHDVYFCTEAAKLGFPVHVDSSMIAEHLGEWRSNKTTYLASTEFAAAAGPWKPPPTMMTPNELTYLAQLAEGKVVLEIGSQYGNSTVAMARTARQVVAVDWFQGDGHAGVMNATGTRALYFQHLEQLGVADKVVTMAGRFEDVLPLLADRNFDLVFLDAFHGEEAVREQLEYIMPLLKDEMWVAVHDYGRFGVKPAVDAFHDLQECDLNIVDTLAVLGYGLPEPELAPVILVPHIRGGLKPQTLEAVGMNSGANINGITVHIELLEGEDAYHNLIAEFWREARTFITLEQDIVPTAEQVNELLTCAEPWCAFEYDYPPFGLYAGMGFAKFSSTLLRDEPRALDITANWSDAKHPAKHWCRVDGYLKQYLYSQGHVQHIHGQVEHLHQGRPAHDCTTPEEAEAIIAQRVPVPT
jgi:predicted O-methyltransferase YrrM